MVLPEMRQKDKTIRNLMCYDCFVKIIWALVVLRAEVGIYTEEEIQLANSYVTQFEVEVTTLENNGVMIRS